MHSTIRTKLLIISTLALVSLGAYAQQQPSISDTLTNGKFYDFSFLGDQKIPDALIYLPAPPQPGDALYKNDVAKYQWGKKLRDTARGDTAKNDVRTDITYLMQRFGAVSGKPLTPKTCPNMSKLFKGIIQDLRGGMENAKVAYARHRPYHVFNEHSSVVEYESPTDFTSYPSGHSLRAWAIAMVFVAIDPAHQNEYLKTGYEMGESRVIVGHHFESDVEAARLCASAGFARLCAEPTFWAYLQLAREEFQNAK